MARQDYETELDLAVRRENWSLHGPNRIVKVLPTSYFPGPRIPDNMAVKCVSGYIGLAKFIENKDPLEIESALGLKKNSMVYGAIICSLLRLPSPTEYSYELSADNPGGLRPTFMSHPDFAPGGKKVHQWEIRKDACVPVDRSKTVLLPPGVPFQG